MQAIIFSVLVFLWLGLSHCPAAERDNHLAATPPLPKGVRVIPPNPQLPPEIRAFSGVWEGTWGFYPHWDINIDNYARCILIVEEIVSPEKVRVVYSVGPQEKIGSFLVGKGSWRRYWGSISKENDTYSLSFQRPDGGVHTFTLKSDKLTTWFGLGISKYHMEMTRRPDPPGQAAERADHLAAAPPLPPEGVKIIPPNPQLPPEIKAFSGVWEGTWGFSSHGGGMENHLRATLIVEEIVSPEKVRLVYSWGPTAAGDKPGWRRHWGSIAKENGRYCLSYKKPNGKPRTFSLAGDQLFSWESKSKYQIKLSRRLDKP